MVGQSHFKTFDSKFFTFTGHCQYLLARDCADHSFSVIIENVQVNVARSSLKISYVSSLPFFLSLFGIWLFCFSVQTMRTLCARAQ